MSIQFTGSAIPPDGTVTAPKINSGAATVGFVLTANGAAGATFAELPAAGGGILASGATVGATAQAQIFTTGVGVGASPPAAMLGVIGADSLNTSFAGNISGATGTGLVVTNANYVGIGTTAPVSKLQVNGTITSGAAGGSYGSLDLLRPLDGGAIGRAYVDSAYNLNLYQIGGEGSMTFSTSGVEAMRILSNGNVGIGTTSPTAALHLPASSTARASLCIPAGTAPTSPVAGDVWVAGTVIKFYNGTTTQEIAFV